MLGVTPSAESLEALTQQPQVAAISYLTFGAERFGYAGLHGNVAYLGGKPVVGVRLSLWGDEPSGAKVGVDGLVQELSLLPKDPNDPNSYIDTASFTTVYGVDESTEQGFQRSATASRTPDPTPARPDATREPRPHSDPV